MHDSANDNPIWDAAIGKTTDSPVIYKMAALVVVTMVGGALAWLIA